MSENNPRILLVLINYKQSRDTTQLIESLEELDDKHLIAKILLISNGEEIVGINNISHSSIAIEEVQIENNGFGAAVNVGFDYAKKYNYNYVWTLNIDVKLSKRTLKALGAALAEDRICGSLVIDKIDGKELYQYGTAGLESWRGYKRIQYVGEKVYKVEAVPGTSMIVGQNIFRNMEFDPAFFMYVEENDLCYRARLQCMDSYICTDSIVYHQSGGSFQDESLRWYYKVRNLLYFKKKQNSKRNNLLIGYLFIITLKRYRLNPKYLSRYVMAVFDYINNRYGKYQKKG